MLQIIVHPFVKAKQCEFYFIALISFHKGSRNLVCKPLHEGTLFALFVQYVNKQYVFKPQKKVSEASCLFICYTVKIIVGYSVHSKEVIFLTPKKPSALVNFQPTKNAGIISEFAKKAQLK
jgi:hypothetical protein